MDTYYKDKSTYFRVCRYNRSSHALISCCSCYESCQWGELSGHSEHNHPSCQLITSQPGLYQFEITTSYYPCYFSIGDPIDVSDVSDANSNHDQAKHIIMYAIIGSGGLSVIIIVLAVIGITLFRYRRHRRQLLLGKLIFYLFTH